MMQDLQGTRQYLFRGFSGRHAAARLLLSKAEWEFRAVVADPRNEGGISGRARYLLRHAAAETDYDTIQARLHEEIRIGLVGLYLARSRCSRIEVTVITDPPLDRLEIFDDSVWVTLYSDASTTAEFPRTLRFSEGSFIYNMERAEFGRVLASAHAHHLVITPATSREDFRKQFEQDHRHAAVRGAVPRAERRVLQLPPGVLRHRRVGELISGVPSGSPH